MRIPLRLAVGTIAPINSINQRRYMHLLRAILNRNGFRVQEPQWISPYAYLETDMTTPTQIGDGVVISHDVKILTHDYSMDRVSAARKWLPSDQQLVHRGPVKIDDYVFIGIGATILPGITIGRSTVVAAGAVVTRDLPSDVVAAGNPARVICTVEEWTERSRHKFEVESRRP